MRRPLPRTVTRSASPCRSGEWEQKPQKYHAKSLQSLKSKYQAMVENPELVEVMTETGCHEYLTH